MEKIVSVDGVDFKYIIDTNNITNEIENLRSKYEDDHFINFYTNESSPSLSEEEYNENVDSFKNNFESFINNIERLESSITVAPKKKNGKLKKNSIIKDFRCKNSIFQSDFHNTWIRAQVKFKPIDEVTIGCIFNTLQDTPG